MLPLVLRVSEREEGMKMNFGLVLEWVNETDGYVYENEIDWYDTKEELLEAYHNACEYYSGYFDIGRLILYTVVRYSPQEISRDF